MAFYTDMAPGDTLVINGTIVTLEKKSGKRARLRVEGDAEVRRVPAKPPHGKEPPDGRRS